MAIQKNLGGGQYQITIDTRDSARFSTAGMPLKDGVYNFNANTQDVNTDTGFAFLISQLTQLEVKLYETLYADIIYPKLLPIKTDVPEGVNSWTYRSYDWVGAGEYISSRGDDLPTVGADFQLHTVNIDYAGMGMEISLQELRRCAQAGIPIDSILAKGVYRRAQEHMQRTMLFGNEKLKQKGLLNNADITKTSDAKAWDSSNPDEILKDINNLLSSVWLRTNQKVLPNKLLIDTKRYNLLATTRIGTYNDKTILRFVKENNIVNEQGQALDIIPVPHLTKENLAAQGFANGGKSRMMAYNANEEYVFAIMNIPPRFIAPQYHNLVIKTPMEYGFSGTEFRYPVTASYQDEV